MAKGNSIVVSPNPRGRFLEGYVNAALKPGTLMQIDVSEGLGDDGRFDYEAWAQGASTRYAMFLLIENAEDGDASTAYASGDRCRIYIPVPGDEVNVLLKASENVALGGLLSIENTSGKLLATTGTPEIEPFVALEASNVAQDALVWSLYTGN